MRQQHLSTRRPTSVKLWAKYTYSAAIALLAFVALQSVAAPSTAQTVDGDKAACLQSDNHLACEQVYDYLFAEMEDAEAKKVDEFLPDLRLIADKGCTSGNGWLCTEIGRSLSKGDMGRSEDPLLALEYHVQACDLGNGLGCARAGMMHQMGKVVEEDEAQAAAYYLKGCALGGMDGCQYQAYLVLLQSLDNIEYSEDSIETLKGRCANTGLIGSACVELGKASFFGDYGMQEDERQAMIYWGKGCARAVYSLGCTLVGLLVLSDTDMSEPHSPNNLSGIQTLYRGCVLGDLPACEFMAMAGQKYAWNYDDVTAQGMYGRCLQKPTIEDCTLSGKAFMHWRYPDNPLKGENASDKSLRAFMTACRTFNVACVDAANMHLTDQTFTIKSVNLALGILKTACGKGEPDSCARYNEVVAETGGVKGSYIDPMLSDDQRFLLARFDIEGGLTQRGRETMQWLAYMGHTHAQLYLAYAYENGLDVAQKDTNGRFPKLPYTVSNKEEMIYKLFDAAAKKGVPDAAMKVAVIKYYENDHEGGDSYEFAISRALYLGAQGANEFAAAAEAQNKARIDARLAAIREMNRQNIESRDNMDRQTVQSAWDQYYKRQKERKEAEGGEVCGIVYGAGNSTYRTCMSRATAMKHYQGSF